MAVLTARRRYTNVAPAATLLAPLNASATTFGVSTGTGFPAVPFTATIDWNTPAEEVILVTGLSGTTVTGCTRGYDGTAAQTHAAGAVFVHTAVARDYDEANDHTSSTAAHGTTGGVVGLTDTQTITNKTISSSKGQATATDPALKLQAFATGVASLIDAYNAAGSGLRFKVGQNGDVVIQLDDPSKRGLVVTAAAAQAVNLVELLNSAASPLLVVGPGGRVTQTPADLTAAAWKYVPPSSTSATFLALRDTADTADQFVLTTDGAITSMAKAWLRGFFSDDVLRYPLDGSLFRVTSTGAIVSAVPIVAPSIVANDVVRRVGAVSDGTTISGGATETMGHSHGWSVVNGRKYTVRCLLTTTGNAGSTLRQFTIRVSSAAVTNTSQLIEAYQRAITGALRDDIYFEGDFTATATATWNIALGVATVGGSGATNITTSEVTLYEVGV